MQLFAEFHIVWYIFPFAGSNPDRLRGREQETEAEGNRA
jgi:hypothetical protein